MAEFGDGVTLYFIRHGETDWNRLKRLQGQMDIPLNDTGRAQAQRNGRRLKDLLGEAIHSYPFVASPLGRTAETMELVREAAGLERGGYATDDRLKEIKYGTWEGAYLEDLKRKDPEGFAQRRADKFNWRPEAGESYGELTERCRSWLETVERDMVVVSHGGVSRVLRGLLLGLPNSETPLLEVPQDKVMILQRGAVDWA